MAKSTPDDSADYHRSVHATLDQLIEQTHRLYRSITDNAGQPLPRHKRRRRAFNQHPHGQSAVLDVSAPAEQLARRRGGLPK